MAQGTGTTWLKNQAKKVSSGEEVSISEAEATSAAVERWLQERKVEYAPPTDIPISLIDERRSRGNQARDTPIVAESVDRYAIAMKNGAMFPPIVCYPQGGKLVIIDGNNRQAARSRAGFDTIYGIVISEETPGELIQLLTVEANAHHGVTPSLQWRLRQAFHLVSMGFTDAMAAEACSVTAQQISNARRVQEADQHARDLKILGFTDLPASSRGQLSPVKDDAVFSRMARLAISSRMTGQEITEMCRLVRNQKSEGARLAAVEDLARERGIAVATQRTTGRSVGRTNSPKTMLASGIAMFLKADEEALVKSIVTSADKAAVTERIRAAEVKIKALKQALAMHTVEG